MISRQTSLTRKLLGLAMLLGIGLAFLFLTEGRLSAPPRPVAAPVTTVTSEDNFQLRDYASLEADSDDVAASSNEWFGLLAGMAAKLGVVIVLIYLATRLIKRYYRPLSTARHRSVPIRMLSSLNLHPSRTVYLLDVGGKILVVGATNNQLNTLAEVTDPVAVEELRGPMAEGNEDFSAVLAATRHKLRDVFVGDGMANSPEKDAAK